MPITRPLRPAPYAVPIPTEGRDISDMQLLALLTSAASIGFLLHYYRWGEILLSGDAVAHINIARRVFDSRTPGPLQLGTVWLPLQHILTIPFIISDFMWSSGLGGAVPSMVSYVLGALGMYRLVRGGLENYPALAKTGLGRGTPATAGLARLAAWLAAGIFAANPNLLYLQTTALNEPMSLALLIWATVFFAEFARLAFRGEAEQASRRLCWCGWLLMCGILVRYDGWFAACAFIVAAGLVIVFVKRTSLSPAEGGRATPRQLRRALVQFVLINAIAPVLWFGYNAFVWGNPLEFATGPYSAKAIERRSRRPGDPHHPGWHSPYVAAEHFLRSATLNLGESTTQPRSPASRWEKPWLPLALAGTVLVIAAARGLLPWLLLWVPLPFYALAISWGGVPIFIPQWWPFSYYNTRYGLQLLPAVAALFALSAYFLMRLRRERWWPALVTLVAIGVVAASYASLWRNVPICLREIRANGASRYALDTSLGATLARLPESSTLLMYLGDHGGALQRRGIPLRRTINEGDYKLWEKALDAPAASANFVIAVAGDPVSMAVAAHPERLQTLVVIDTPGQPPVTIYRALK